MILAIETSCDETAVAVVERRSNGTVRVVSESLATSLSSLAVYGGIVPEVAARAQLEFILPVLKECLSPLLESGESLQSWVESNIDAIAYTKTPGLIGSLLVGEVTAQALALAWNKPLLQINHLDGHLAAAWIGDTPPELPALGLLVSGGHTLIARISRPGKVEVLATTSDDAAGECLDKTARLLGLPYPGGKALSELAATAHTPSRFLNLVPRPLLGESQVRFSFSGLKAAVARVVAQVESETDRAQLAAAIQDRVVDHLIRTTSLAYKQYGPFPTILVAGGVAANTHLRQSIRELADSHQAKFVAPMLEYCTDNASMIGAQAAMIYDK